MNVLFFLGHPAHFHLFKNVIRILESKGFKVKILIKEKDVLESLLKSENFYYENIQPNANKKRGNNRFSILWSSGMDLLDRDLRLFKIVRKFKPNFMLGTESSITHIGRLLNIPSLVFNEDDASSQPEFCYPTYPFASYIVSPNCVSAGKWEGKKIGYNGYHELAYLSPKYFQPDRSVLPGKFSEPFFILRLVSLTASHDVGKSGLQKQLLKNIIDLLENKGAVFITSERPLEAEFEKYRIQISPSKIHHALAFCEMLVADSQTMIAEAAILGTPSIRFSDFVSKLNYLVELEHKYGLTYGIKTDQPDQLLNKIRELLAKDNLKTKLQKKRKIMLEDMIDVTAFMVWFIENYPQSVAKLQSYASYRTHGLTPELAKELF